MSTPHSDIVIVSSLKGTHFTGALAQNAIESESLDFPADWQTIKIDKCIIEGINIQSDQNLSWDIIIWSTSGYDDTDLDAAELVDIISFANTSGDQIAGTAQFYYPSPTLEIPYEDESKTQKLHVSLVNRHATAKNAGATGEIVVKFTLRPVRGV